MKYPKMTIQNGFIKINWPEIKYDPFQIKDDNTENTFKEILSKSNSISLKTWEKLNGLEPKK